ncbi:unnamed protein product [Blepharisma stoltei]|uniref:CCHC-type domain-containing protein n=1 Tax=Blepharisma stoltei TaxID=1481888 RepID=A0AAU9K4S0_9CILI|nr:unnamed protein product [Blepharisma stoltei]
MSELDPRPAIYRETLIKLYLLKGLSPPQKSMLERMQNLLSKNDTHKVLKEGQSNHNQYLTKGYQQDIPNCQISNESENGNSPNENQCLLEESKEGFEQKCNYPQMNIKLADKEAEKMNSTDEAPNTAETDIEIEEAKDNKKIQKNTENRKCFQCCEAFNQNHECKFRLCDNCNQPGHFFRNCPWKSISKSTYDGTLCSLCQTRGHKAANCIKRSYPLSKSSEFSNARCYVCKKVGHLNCTVEDVASSSESDSSSDG